MIFVKLSNEIIKTLGLPKDAIGFTDRTGCDHDCHWFVEIPSIKRGVFINVDELTIIS